MVYIECSFPRESSDFLYVITTVCTTASTRVGCVTFHRNKIKQRSILWRHRGRERERFQVRMGTDEVSMHCSKLRRWAKGGVWQVDTQVHFTSKPGRAGGELYTAITCRMQKQPPVQQHHQGWKYRLSRQRSSKVLPFRSSRCHDFKSVVHWIWCYGCIIWDRNLRGNIFIKLQTDVFNEIWTWTPEEEKKRNERVRKHVNYFLWLQSKANISISICAWSIPYTKQPYKVWTWSDKNVPSYWTLFQQLDAAATLK